MTSGADQTLALQGRRIILSSSITNPYPETFTCPFFTIRNFGVRSCEHNTSR